MTGGRREAIGDRLWYPMTWMMRFRRLAWGILIAGPLTQAWALPVEAAPGPEPPAGGFLEPYAATYRFRLGRPTGIKVTPDGTAVLFLRTGPRDFERVLYELDVATGQERVLLRAEQLLAGDPQTVSAREKARRQRRRIVARGITSYQLAKDGQRLLVPLSGRLFVLDRASGEVHEVTIDAGPAEVPQLSPDGTRIGYVVDGDLYVVEVNTGEQRRLTNDAGAEVTNGLAEFVAQEEMGRHRGFWWSPDSMFIACQQTDTTGVERMNIVDPNERRFRRSAVFGS